MHSHSPSQSPCTILPQIFGGTERNRISCPTPPVNAPIIIHSLQLSLYLFLSLLPSHSLSLFHSLTIYLSHYPSLFLTLSISLSPHSSMSFHRSSWTREREARCGHLVFRVCLGMCSGCVFSPGHAPKSRTTGAFCIVFVSYYLVVR